MFMDTMNSRGGNSVAIGFDQLIGAIQTSVVDSTENNCPSYESGRRMVIRSTTRRPAT